MEGINFPGVPPVCWSVDAVSHNAVEAASYMMHAQVSTGTELMEFAANARQTI